jgi:hypothetical protein
MNEQNNEDLRNAINLAWQAFYEADILIKEAQTKIEEAEEKYRNSCFRFFSAIKTALGQNIDLKKFKIDHKKKEG